MLQELQDFGLSEKEAKVYLASLEIGRATADQLGKQAKVNRSTTYVQIESLMKKGLISTHEEGKKTYFTPESPENLNRLFKKQQQELEIKQKELSELLPELVRLHDSSGERPKVSFYEGKEGVVTVREDALKARGKEIFVIYSYSKFREIFSEEELNFYSKRRAERKIKSRVIYTHVEEPDPDYVPPALTEVQFFEKGQIPLNSDILIYDNRVAFIVLERNAHAVVIESEAIAESTRSLFWFLWNLKRGPVFSN